MSKPMKKPSNHAQNKQDNAEKIKVTSKKEQKQTVCHKLTTPTQRMRGRRPSHDLPKGNDNSLHKKRR